MNNILYQTMGLYNESQRKEFVEGYVEFQCMYLGIENFYLTDLYDKDFTNYLIHDNELWWEEVSSELSRLMRGKEYQINAVLEFWDGKKNAVVSANGFNAIIVCLGHDSQFELKIYEENGVLMVDYYHHDGTHHFVINEKTSEGLKSPFLLKELFN